MLLAGPAAAAPKPPPPDVFTPVVASVVHPPEPVPGTDGRIHLAYELELINRSLIQGSSKPSTATLKRIQVLDQNGKVLATLSGAKLAGITYPFGNRGPSAELAPGQAGLVQMDVTLPPSAPLPRRLSHRISISLKPDLGIDAKDYTAAATAVVQHQAILIPPPLRGPGWIVGNGCCATPSSHRNALLPIAGGLALGERFAIDFIQVGADGRMIDGPPTSLSSYPFFGDPVYSVGAGTVVSTVDDLPEAPPGKLPPTTAGDAGGNQVVVKLGPGRYAFYGHLQPDSVTVRPGQKVRAGQVLGLLGSSGNSNAPHLHFQLMDGPTPLAAEGIPFRFNRFTVAGTLTNFGGLFEGETAQVDPEFAGPHSKELPLNQEVIGFP